MTDLIRKGFTVDTYKYMSVGLKMNHDLNGRFYEICMTGNLEFLKFIMEPLMQFENFGFNKLHLQVIS